MKKKVILFVIILGLLAVLMMPITKVLATIFVIADQNGNQLFYEVM